MAGESGRCIEHLPQNKYPKIGLSDPGTGRTVVFLNLERQPARRIRMDGCLAPEGAKAADYVLSLRAVIDVIVELKGKNVDHAVMQIDASLDFWSRHSEHVSGQTISAFIVCKEYPRADRKFKRCQENLRKRGGILKLTARNGEERPFSDFVPKRP
jgi:hypothetical protein